MSAQIPIGAQSVLDYTGRLWEATRQVTFDYREQTGDVDGPVVPAWADLPEDVRLSVAVLGGEVLDAWETVVFTTAAHHHLEAEK
jgi:hypothetical protein